MSTKNPKAKHLANLQRLVEALEELGFGTDESISGADTVDVIGEHWKKLKQAVNQLAD